MLLGYYGILQIHRGGCETETRIDSTGEEEWRETRVPRLKEELNV